MTDTVEDTVLGKRFGTVTLTEPIDLGSAHGYRGRFDCGCSVFISASKLWPYIWGERCQTCTPKPKDWKEKATSQSYSTYRSGAIARGLLFEIDRAQFATLRSGDCFYCGLKGPNGVDRYDNGLGYIWSNCRSCCTGCNMTKGDRDAKTFIEHSARIAEHTKRTGNG